jgi:DNA-binding CsgD family transcriptional regulator
MRYARAVLAPDADALPAFEAALAADLSGWPFEQGRLLLAHGQWLRRARRPAESRPPLRRAREIFDSLGAPAWGERARQELRAAGESSAERTTWAREELTPQELQIAMKAAQGMTNREIAQDLYISHRTVGAHLYRVFPKLGITTRAQLAQALDRARATGTETETEGGTKTGTGPGTATEAG